MAAWVPFFQTFLWVALTIGILWRFHAQVVAVLDAIRDRVRAGSSVKAGPFELGESPPVQPIEMQRKEFEIAGSIVSNADAVSPPDHPRQFTSKYFLAEDLAMRELQIEFGVSINRQVKIGRDNGVDGLFVKDGRQFLIEMKYATRPIDSSLIRSVIDRLISDADRSKSENVSTIFAIVYDTPNLNLVDEKSRLVRDLAPSRNPVLIRIYSFATLAQKYGLEIDH